MTASHLYEQDFYAWASEQATLLRSGQLSAADIEHIAEEIESMGKAEKRELVSRLAILLMHLLKWQFQPERQSRSWRATITVQRNAVTRHLRDNPSLKSKLPEAISDAYDDAVQMAVGETDLPEQTFPGECPWTFETFMEATFWPLETARP